MTPEAQLTAGYGKCCALNLVINSTMEKELANHIREMDNRYYGLSAAKCMVLAYEYATMNDVKVPDSWEHNKSAGIYEKICLLSKQLHLEFHDIYKVIIILHIFSFLLKYLPQS